MDKLKAFEEGASIVAKVFSQTLLNGLESKVQRWLREGSGKIDRFFLLTHFGQVFSSLFALSLGIFCFLAICWFGDYEVSIGLTQALFISAVVTSLLSVCYFLFISQKSFVEKYFSSQLAGKGDEKEESSFLSLEGIIELAKYLQSLQESYQRENEKERLAKLEKSLSLTTEVLKELHEQIIRPESSQKLYLKKTSSSADKIH